MFGSFGFGEMLFVLVVLLLLFGAKRLPEIGSSLGRGIREFKRSVNEIQGEVTRVDEQGRVQPGSETRTVQQQMQQGTPTQPVQPVNVAPPKPPGTV